MPTRTWIIDHDLRKQGGELTTLRTFTNYAEALTVWNDYEPPKNGVLWLARRVVSESGVDITSFHSKSRELTT